MKYFYMVVTVELDKNENIFSDEKKEPKMGLLSYPITVNENQNLLCELEAIKGLKNVTMFATKKRAKEHADFWNECYKKNGNYYFSK